MKGWDYQAAFSRNLGLVTAEEQERLRQTCVAIAGSGWPRRCPSGDPRSIGGWGLSSGRHGLF